MRKLFDLIQWISDKLKILGAACLVGMTGLTCVDVVGRFFKHPVFGSVELVTFMGTLSVALALPYTHQERGHIGVEIFVRRFSRKTRLIIDICTGMAAFVFFALVTWRMFDYGLKMRESGEVSMNLGLPEYLIILVVAVCFVVFSLMIIKTIVDYFQELRGK